MVLGCLVAASMASTAHAHAIGWRAPAECPNVAELRARVEELASSPMVGAPMEASVVREGAAFVARIQAGAGARELRASDCDTLTSAVALVMATAMTELPAEPVAPEPAPLEAPPLEVASLGASDGAAEEEASLEASPLDASVADDVDASSLDEGLRFVVSATSGAVLGLFGGAEALVAVSLGLRADGFEVALGWARAFRVDAPDTDTERATLRLGWVMRWSPLEVAFRVLGDVYTSFRGLDNDRSGALWGMVGAGTEVRLWIEDAAAVTLSFDGTIPVTRSPVHLEGPRPFDELPTLASVVTGGIFFPIP